MERLQEPMSKLLTMDSTVLEMPVFKAAQHSYHTVMAEMQQYEQALVQDWCAQVCQVPVSNCDIAIIDSCRFL